MKFSEHLKKAEDNITTDKHFVAVINMLNDLEERLKKLECKHGAWSKATKPK